jgi:hypothetical protein
MVERSKAMAGVGLRESFGPVGHVFCNELVGWREGRGQDKDGGLRRERKRTRERERDTHTHRERERERERERGGGRGREDVLDMFISFSLHSLRWVPIC